jgi:hypothetical protein
MCTRRQVYDHVDTVERRTPIRSGIDIANAEIALAPPARDGSMGDLLPLQFRDQSCPDKTVGTSNQDH